MMRSSSVIHRPGKPPVRVERRDLAARVAPRPKKPASGLRRNRSEPAGLVSEVAKMLAGGPIRFPKLLWEN